MSNRKNIGILVAAAGLILTCCLCPLAVNNAVLIASFASNPRNPTSLYGQIFAFPIGSLGAGTYVSTLQLSCSVVIAIILLVVGVLVVRQARSNASTPNP
ncbi:MAG: hypothetical protein KGJ80_06050 [Chloroflexota bacterium]|nr:hypothetical protein [Chloroflexota bacterium]